MYLGGCKIIASTDFRYFRLIRIFVSMDRGEIIIYQTADGETRLDVRMENDSVWLTQAQMVELFNSTKQNVSLHINNIFKEGELEREATVKEYLIVRQEGNRSVRRKITVYNLDVIISVGYRVKSQRGTQFRIWANKILKEYLIKGYAVNTQRIRTFLIVSILKRKSHLTVFYHLEIQETYCHRASLLFFFFIPRILGLPAGLLGD